ncbi:MAG TPA: DNA-directed RNA polymerase subunit alpha [Candidatus Saccharimonadales bacterium]|nr:DNA-directed RNA polymerase subunit alpha [Candidatus Saccharimonadales bacterium]
MTKNIHVPGVVKTEDHGKTQSTFTIEPLHSGYGMTLGNSLRRVLLSSISGAAITAFKVEGASHEFTTLPGVKEDIVEIILNLKGVRFRIFSDEPQTIRLSKKGSGAVTAKDIQVNADVEVVNKDHVIAHIDGASASINMDIVVEKGRGYRAIDESGSKKVVSDMIAIDSIFSPVLRVRYKVENTRVGQMTDLDKLIITVETDGTITPREAFEEASAILVNQYTALAGQTRVEQGAPLNAADESSDEAGVSDDSPALMTSIEDLNLSARTTNALVNNDIHTLKDLFALSDMELRELKGFGSKALDEVKEKMAEMEF